MFDRSHLPPAEWEFVAISDTHYMLDPGDRPLEFESRRKQTARSEVALKLVASLSPDVVIHLGDLVQEYPETDRFPGALDEALVQMERCGVRANLVAGNHDVGDKPDPTMPTRPVTPESLARYHGTCGPSWYAIDRSECHFVVLNSQILNASLPEAGHQRNWLEEDLRVHRGKRIILCLHLPPYLSDEREPGTGHYDVVDHPDRSWLLELVRDCRAELLLAGHTHFAFYDRLHGTRIHVLPSPSFTRPGFCHLFTGPAPPERGRDDTAKMGFTLFRVLPDRVDAHFIRTGGAVDLPRAVPGGPQRLITRTPSGLPDSPLGLTLRQPLATVSDVPLVSPSVVRQPVRNDYPLLACLELGVASLRVPWTDLEDPVQGHRLAVLRGEDIRITATLLGAAVGDLPGLLERHGDRVDTWEFQPLGAPWPAMEQLRAIRECRGGGEVALALCPVVPGERQKGKQHPRTRLGYRISELDRLNDRLAREDTFVHRVLCRVDRDASPWHVVRKMRQLPRFSHIGTVDVAVELPWQDDDRNARRAAEACFAAAILPGSRVYFDPLVDLDRTMDICHGLLDTLCNPRPAFHVLRCLNTVLNSHPRRNSPDPSDAQAGPIEVRTLTGTGEAHCLILGHVERALDLAGLPVVAECLAGRRVRLYRLCEGTVETVDPDRIGESLSGPGSHSPLLLSAS